MKPLEIAARFAAFTWYMDCRKASKDVTQAEARLFAHENWQDFLPVVQDGLGKLLLRIAKESSTQKSPTVESVRRTKKRSVAAA